MKKNKSKLEIAFIIPGGIGTGRNNMGIPVLEQLVKRLSKDYNITVFSLFQVNKDYQPDGFELASINAPNVWIRAIKFFTTFRSKHRSKKFILIHGFWALPSGFLAVVTGRLFKVKSIVSVLGGDAVALPEIQYGQMRHWISRRLILSTLHRANEIIFLTRFLVDQLTEKGFHRADFKIIPWGINGELFTFREKTLNNPIQFLHIANLSPVKDQTTLLKAFKIISDQVPAFLTIIGEGVSEKKVKMLAIDLNLSDKILLKDPMPYETLPLHYQAADILLHTSLSEGQSEVVTEAMSSGVLVCGTRVGLLYDLPACCVSVPVQDYEQLGRAVLNLLDSPDRMEQIRNSGKAWTSAHSLEWTVSCMSKLYEELLG